MRELYSHGLSRMCSLHDLVSLLSTALLVASALPAAEARILLSINAAGQTTIDGQAVPEDKVERLLGERVSGTVHVEVHPELHFEEAAQLLDAAFAAGADEVRLQLRDATQSMRVFFTNAPEAPPGATPGKSGIFRVAVSTVLYPTDHVEPAAAALVDARVIAIPRVGQMLLIRTPRDVTPPETLQGRQIEPYLRERLAGATDRAVFLSVDRSAPFGEVLEAAEIARAAGASRIGFLTRSGR